MANKMPSLVALLGMLAVAGFQNRDKLGQILGQTGLGQNGGNPNDPRTNTAGAGDFGQTVGDAGKVLGQTATDVGGSLMKGLDELLGTFRNAGQRETADSWITPGVPTQGLSRDGVETAIGRDTLEGLARETGMDYDSLLDRLAKVIPDAVDKATPDGHFPSSDDEVRNRIMGA